MSSGQEKIHEFPDDDSYWFIKWIDEFQIPHLGTRSASVSVILQKLPVNSISDLTSLTQESLFQILGQRSKRDPEIEVLERNPVVMPGTLPLLYIGAVFQRQVRVGALPVKRLRLELMNGGHEGEEIALGKSIAPPPGWIKNFPYSLLNRYEYSTVKNRMAGSRCLVIQRRGIKYLIPRTTIFKTFYACHTELAKAFCNGPWIDRLHDVICLNDFKSGLKTEIDSSGQWNVILQTLVPDDYAELLALYYFDPFAKACAESIYSKSLQDRGALTQGKWYASAQIPFRPDSNKLLLDVRGFQLRSWVFKDEDDEDAKIQKFLVTEIVGCNWPAYIPDIGYERFNSGLTGESQTNVDGHKPFPKPNGGKPSDSNTKVDGEHDALAGSEITHMNSTEFGWINGTRKKKLKKNSSQRFTDPAGPTIPPATGHNVSTGEHTNQNDANVKGETEVIVRMPEKRFEQILEVFEYLKSSGTITSKRELACPIAGKQIRRGSIECWSFIDDASIKNYRAARKGWRLAEYNHEDVRKCKHRSALVVKFEMSGKSRYWIEIECKGKEGGYRSPLLSNVNGNESEVINAALEVIATKKGINLGPALNDMLGDYGVVVDCYKHIYVSKELAKLDIDSVKRFLNG